MDRRIVITGMGVLASVGTGKGDFWGALREGKSGVKPVTLFDTTSVRSKLAGEIRDFSPETILGVKGLRTLDRATKLALSAAKLALDDAGIAQPIPEDKTDLFGVALGTTLGSVWSISEFDKEALREGPRSVNPALFPNTVINSPASQISIKFNIQGFNATISTGFSSSLDAIAYAMNMMERYDYRVVLAGGVEELCEQTYKGFAKIGHLAGSRPLKDEINCPFDKRRNGIVLGEGAAIFVLEELGHALDRNAVIYAELAGYGTSFDPASHNRYSPRAAGAAEAIRLCLEDAGIEPGEVDYIASSANSTLDCDAMETSAVKHVFGDAAKKVPVSSVKSMIGDCFSASGAMNVASSLGVINGGVIPPTINYQMPDRRCDLDYVPNEAREAKVLTALVNAFSPTGANASVAIRKYS